MKRNMSMPYMWSAFDDDDHDDDDNDDYEEGGVWLWQHVARTTPSLLLLPSSLTAPAALTPSSTRTPSSKTPPSSQARTPSSFAFPLSPITPSAFLTPSARTPSSARTTSSAVTRSAPRRLVSTTPSAPTPSARRASTAPGTPEPVAVASALGDSSAAAPAVGWTGGGGGGGGGGDVGWGYDEFYHSVDGEERSLETSLQLFEFFGSKKSAEGSDSEGNYETGDDDGDGGSRNGVDDVVTDDEEARALRALAAGESSYLSARGDEEGGLRPCSPPQRSAVGEGAFVGGAGIARGDDAAAAVRVLPTPLGGRRGSVSDYNGSSSPTLTGAGIDHEGPTPSGGVAEGAILLVSSPPRLMRLRTTSDGRLFESSVRRPPVHRRKRRGQGRQQRHGDEPEGGARGSRAETDGSIRSDVQRRKAAAAAAAMFDSSDDDEDTSSALDRVPPQLRQGGSTAGTPGGAVKTPTDAAHAEGFARGHPSPEEKEGKREAKQEAEIEGEEAGTETRWRRCKSAPAPKSVSRPPRLRSSSFAHELVTALEDLHQPMEKEEEDQRRRLQREDQRDQPDGEWAAGVGGGPAQSSSGRRGRDKQRSSSLGNHPWSKSRGRSLGAGGGGGGVSGTSSRCGSGTSGGGSRRGSEIFGKLKGMLSLDPRPRSPVVRPMSRIEQHKARLEAEAFQSPGTRPASSSVEDEPCPEDEMLEGALKSQKGAGMRASRRVPGWRPRGTAGGGGGGGGCKKTIMKLQ